MTLLCPVNISEGRSQPVLDALVSATGDDLLDLHVDRDHHRSVFTVVGPEAPRRLARIAVERIDLRLHAGAHPRLGVIDVVPFVPLSGSTMADAVEARAAAIGWLASELGIPAFAYGADAPSLPEVRRQAFRDLAPSAGPDDPHPSAGAVAVGARLPLVAYNVWLRDADLALGREIAAAVRSPAVRALGLRVGERVQVSMNLVDPATVGPEEAFDAVAALATVAGAELVGLVPAAVLRAVPRGRWAELDLGPDRTVEARLERWSADRRSDERG